MAHSACHIHTCSTASFHSSNLTNPQIQAKPHDGQLHLHQKEASYHGPFVHGTSCSQRQAHSSASILAGLHVNGGLGQNTPTTELSKRNGSIEVKNHETSKWMVLRPQLPAISLLKNCPYKTSHIWSNVNLFLFHPGTSADSLLLSMVALRMERLFRRFHLVRLVLIFFKFTVLYLIMSHSKLPAPRFPVWNLTFWPFFTLPSQTVWL